MLRKLFSHKIFIAGSITFLSFFLALIVSLTSPLRTIELKWLDNLFEYRGPISTKDSPIVLVAISEQTDSELSLKYPYPTNLYAKLVDNLNKAGARVIGFDIIFNKEDIYNPENDSIFAKTIAESGNIVLSGNINNERRVSYSGEQSALSNTINLVPPAPIFENANPNPWGFVSVITDIDAFIRNYYLKQTHLGNDYYAFGLEVLRKYEGYSVDVKLQEFDKYFKFGDYIIPKNNSGTMSINFHGPAKSFTQHEMDVVIDDADFDTDWEIMTGEAINAFDDPEFGLLYTDTFQDKIVLIGNIMVEFHDIYATPFASKGTMPGYEIHANALQTIIDGNYVLDIEYNLELLIIFLVVLFVVFVTKYVRATWGIVNIILSLLAFIAGTIYLFTSYGYHLEITASISGMLIGFISTVTFDFLTEQREKRRIKNMFSSYVSPDLVNKMIESGEDPQLGGNDSFITAFFSDIQSFSTFSEKLTPKQLVDLINEYLTAMTDILSEEGGTLDKYIGDAIVAFYGAPLPLEDHAYRACRTAVLMQDKQAELRDKWKNEPEWPEVVHYMMTRIGINTGEMVTGNMGSKSRFNYTMMGDNVNLAARCESGAKSFGVFTMITEETKLEAEKYGDDLLYRYLDKIVVKGRSIPVKMYEIVGFKNELKPNAFKAVELYEEGMKYYAEQKWDLAIQKLDEATQYEVWKPGILPNVNTNPSMIMLERCKSMKDRDYIENWDGVFVMTSK